MKTSTNDTILYSYKHQLKQWTRLSSLQKLNLIYEIIQSIETNLKMCMISRSPLIQPGNIYLNEIRKMKSDISTFLLDMSKDTSSTYYHYAMILLGISYENELFGISSSSNSRKPINHYTFVIRNTKKRHWLSLALYRKAICYEKGIGTRVKSHKAVTYYRISAKLNNTKALHVYGSILLYGLLNVKPNHSEASIYLKQAVQKSTLKYPYAWFELGVLYEYSDIFKDLKYAIRCYEKGSALNCRNCSYKLASGYEKGLFGLKQNTELALFYHKKARHSESFLFLSYYYLLFKTGSHHSLPTEQSVSVYNKKQSSDIMRERYQKAYKYALKAALSGNLEALRVLGTLYKEGKGVKASKTHALWWYKIAKECSKSNTILVGDSTTNKKINKIF
ncbi:Protein SKT5 [Cucumispora dikerogammari]|nr:Protein SKT5 [Cucumispora dikerogammari]